MNAVLSQLHGSLAPYPQTPVPSPAPPTPTQRQGTLVSQGDRKDPEAIWTWKVVFPWPQARFSLTCRAAPRLRVCRDDSRVTQATEVKAIAVVVILLGGRE